MTHVALLVLMSVAAPGAGATPPAKLSHDARYDWALTDIYPSDAEWSRAYERLSGRLGELAHFSGTLGKGPGYLAACLENLFDMQRDLERIRSYASMRSDEDLRDAGALEMKQKAQTLSTRFGQASSFLKPEVLALGEKKVRAFVAREPRLAPFDHYLDDILRRKPHTLDAARESLLAAAGLMAHAPSNVYGVLSNAEIPWPTVTLSDGTEVVLDQAAYTHYRASPNAADRKLVFDAFWGTWNRFRRTLGVALYSELEDHLFYARARDYDSCLASALDSDHVPVAVYETLLESTNDNLATLHRYLRLRARMLGIEHLGYQDVYPPLVHTDLKYPIARGESLMLEALQPLGKKYVDIVRKGLDSRWMDVYPGTGKRAGAYTNGSAYDVHPYVLLNYTGDYESVSTMTHEWGHAMHSELANTHQPFAKSDYSIFVAEVASTFNEALLLDHVLKTAKNDEERLYYLGSALEGLRTTFFRQAMFAEFELEIHRRVEKGEALTGDSFSRIYGDILRRYYGQAEGVTTIADPYTVEWAYIPHFYYDFYVYKYATSIAASSLLAKKVLAGEPGARDRYLELLEKGGSEYPYAMLKEAGVDLATAAPYDALFARMNRIMDRIEAILDKQHAASASK